MSLLPSTADRWRSRIRQERQGEGLFYRRWAYIRDVQLVDDRVVVTFKRPLEPHSSEPYDFEIAVTHPTTGDVLVRRAHEMVLPSRGAIRLPRAAVVVRVNIQLAGNLAYDGTVVREGVFESMLAPDE